ncbi:hypothetical protein GCM10010261_62350 [Streptomyces pilosus]|uniref:hypothetical protein n=1 Tax=Streptomyces pilosus TaxID=28893 RepID=UPI0019B0C802|nr:hypothetical protein [Streptomyces pilosus]GGV68572.1 hypothetical protein GCM10010261_62350 [Streptomyces pilosus]
MVVTQWQERKAVGDAHEQRVASALAAQGWTVERCGQSTYPPVIRQALACTTSALRWFPDLIAARAGEIVTIDTKDCMPSNSSGRYAVADQAVHAGLQFIAANRPTPQSYVFGDLRVLTRSRSSTTPATPNAVTTAPTAWSAPARRTPSTPSSAAVCRCARRADRP